MENLYKNLYKNLSIFFVMINGNKNYHNKMKMTANDYFQLFLW